LLETVIEKTWEAYIKGKRLDQRLYKIHRSLLNLQYEVKKGLKQEYPNEVYTTLAGFLD
jgi:hypothetical protein